jgi:transposase
MSTVGTEIASKNLDHLGLVAAVAQELKIADRINQALKPADPQREVDAGTAVVAMILNGLGFTGRRLYLTPQYFDNKPVDRLLGEGLKASMLTEHALGRALDDIADFGTTELFAKVAFDIALEHELLGELNHLDTTSLSVQGQYEEDEHDENEQGAEVESKSPVLTYGHSKDHRPDLIARRV